MAMRRALTPSQVSFVREQAQRGRSHREIQADLEAQGCVVDTRTVGRWIQRGRPVAPLPKTGRVNATVDGERPATGKPDAFNERAELLSLVAELKATLETGIAATDRARVVTELRKCGERVAMIDAATDAKGRTSEDVERDAAKVRRKLIGWAEQAHEAEKLRRVALEAALATVPPKVAADVRAALAINALDVTPTIETDDDEEALHEAI